MNEIYPLLIENSNYFYFIKVEFTSLIYNNINLNPILFANLDKPVQ